MKSLKYLFLFVVALFSTTVVLSSCGDDDEDLKPILKTDYDVIQINGESYACYGHRCPITYASDWDLSSHRGTLRLPCGKLSDAQKEEYSYDELYEIRLRGSENLKTGSKLEDFSPTFNDMESGSFDYVSGSATITDKKDDKYITVKFDSFKFASGSKSYILNGTVQLDLDED